MYHGLNDDKIDSEWYKYPCIDILLRYFFDYLIKKNEILMTSLGLIKSLTVDNCRKNGKTSNCCYEECRYQDFEQVQLRQYFIVTWFILQLCNGPLKILFCFSFVELLVLCRSCKEKLFHNKTQITHA